MSPPASASQTSTSSAPRVVLGSDFGVVGSITLSDASTTAVYDDVVITKYKNIGTPTVVETEFPEYDSKGVYLSFALVASQRATYASGICIHRYCHLLP